MPTELKRLKIDRVDLVPEGANSAAFVTLYKGKEMKSMDASEILEKLKPEHAEVIKSAFAELEKQKKQAEDEAAAAKKEAADAKAEAAKKPAGEPSAASAKEDEAKKACGEKKGEPSDAAKAKEGTTSFDDTETLTKGLDPQVAAYIEQIKKQKDAAEEAAREAIAKERHMNAVNKAAELKALPIAADELISFIEKSSDETVDMLSAIAKGIEGTVLSEVGKSTDKTFSASSSDAWARIEKAAEKIAAERNVSVAKATGMVIKEQPELYKEYLEGGAN